MKKSLPKGVRMTLLVMVLVTTTAVADCTFSQPDFAGSYGCTTGSCGFGCGTEYNYQSHWACTTYVAGDATDRCCICSWTSWDCDCIGAQGHGSVSSRMTGSGACPPYSVGGYQPASCVSTD